MPGSESTTQWTCARCTVTASWTEGIKEHSLPSDWVEQDGAVYCLSCSRELSGREDATARIESEVSRDPNRGDTKIARASRSSLMSVRKVRQRLGVYPTGPS